MSGWYVPEVTKGLWRSIRDRRLRPYGSGLNGVKRLETHLTQEQCDDFKT